MLSDNSFPVCLRINRDWNSSPFSRFLVQQQNHENTFWKINSKRWKVIPRSPFELIEYCCIFCLTPSLVTWKTCPLHGEWGTGAVVQEQRRCPSGGRAMDGTLCACNSPQIIRVSRVSYLGDSIFLGNLCGWTIKPFSVPKRMPNGYQTVPNGVAKTSAFMFCTRDDNIPHLRPGYQ